MNYIYLVRCESDQMILAGFTRKYLAHRWADQSVWDLDQIELVRLNGHIINWGKTFNKMTVMEWEQ